MFRKITALFLACALLASVSVLLASANYEQEGDFVISPRYTYVKSISPGLSISGSTGKISGIITGYSSVTKMEWTVSLQVKNSSSWRNVISWTGYTTGTSGSYNHFNSVTTEKTYRTKTVLTAYAGSKSETVAAYSGEKTA